MRLNHLGNIVRDEWLLTETIRDEISLDVFQVMPNHIHGIVAIAYKPETANAVIQVGAHGRAPLHRSPKSLGSLIAGFKSSATKRINKARHSPGDKVWQRNYYERVVRGQTDLDRIRRYIVDNPLKWEEDQDNPKDFKAYTGNAI